MAQHATAVIGAGVVGCMVARELAARDPEVSITVFDRDAIGAGASRRSAGLHLPRGATPRIRAMSALSHACYADLRLLHPELPIYPVGATVITGGADDGRLGGGYLDEAAPAPVASTKPDSRENRSPENSTPDNRLPDNRLPGNRLPGNRLPGNRLPGNRGAANHEPHSRGTGASSLQNLGISVPDGSRAWQVAGCHYADVYGLTQAMAAGLRPRVRFLEGVAVTGLVSGAGTVTVHGGTGERFVAHSVILAPGPWLSAPAWHDLVAPLGLRVKKIVALHIEQRPAPSDEAVILDDEDAFLLPLAHRGHWLFSYTCKEWDVDPDGLAAGLSAANVGAARECLRRYSPALADACRAGRVFCDAYSPDAEPVVRALDDAGRIIFAGAANGSGYRLAPAIGSEAVDLLLELRGSPPGFSTAERRSHR